MELRKQIIKKNYKKGNAFSQITLDDDYIVPDSKPDVVKIIHNMGNIVFEEPKVSNQAIWVKGRMDFAALYRSDQAEDKMEILSGSIPFQEKISMDGIDDLDPVHLNWNLEDLTVNLINSRKLGVRAVVDIIATAEENTEEEIASGMDGEEDYQQKVSDRTLLTLVTAKKDILRIRNEIALPNAKPNIYKLLWKSIQPRGLETSLENGKVKVTGEAQIGILYRTDEDNQIQWFEVSMPIQGEVECDECESSDIFWAKLEPVTLELETRSDYDGEERLLGIEIVFDVDLKIWREQTIPVLEDAFSLESNLIPKCKETTLQELLVKNHAKVRMAEQMHLEKEQEKILQICSCEGEIHIDETLPTQDGVVVNGVLSISILYVTPEDNFPVEHVKEMLPFEQLVEVPGMSENAQYDLDYGVDQLNVNLLDSTEYEVKAAISLRLLALEKQSFCKIEDIEETPMDMEQLQQMAGLTGYVVKPGEELWDIAKKYHTTLEDLMETNELKARSVKPGSKLIIVKKVS